MASPPPPYANITGISRSVMKDNAQENIVNYDGNARPGELVLNLETDPPTLYVGNNLGQLTLVSTGGGNASTGNVTFNNQVVIGTGDPYGDSGLYLAPGANSTANVQYLRVRGGDFPTHIHLDTGNNQYFDQYFGADSKFVKLEANGNIVINANDYAGNGASWTFSVDGELTTPQGGRLGVAGKGWTGLDGGNGAPVSVTSYYANGFYAGCFSAYPDGNVNISTYTGSTNYYWNFDNTGALNLPITAGSGVSVIAAANAYPELLAYGSGGLFGSHGGPELDWMDADDPANTFLDVNTYRNTLYINNQGLYVGLNENGNAGHFAGSLTLSSTNGDLTVPGNIVTNGASGNITGANVITANVFSSAGNTTVGNLLTFANLAVSGGDPLTATDTTIAFKIPVTINGNVYYLSLTAAQ